MTSDERKQRVEDLFLEAADLQPKDRRVFLQEACAGDLDLLKEVESLLAFDSKDVTGLVSIVEKEVAGISTGLNAGDRIGLYRIIREIGHGGMGTVYLADRADNQFRKEVAIKVIRRGMDTVAVIERFRNERQILAGLDHPYIAQLFDGGSTPDGRPYLVMEYVQGSPAAEYCDAKRLTVKERCRLMLRICEAISYAHRNLVVHRDLKPSNILVTADGSPKLLDFGIAKLLNPDANRTTLTRTLAPALTPEYASPEQVLGDVITTSTDVYSLGAVFFHLLTGCPPHSITSTSPREWEKSICEREVRKPSEVARERGRTEEVDSDLDTIILMAMQKDASRRYRSVDEFAQDMERFLDGLPVRARPDTLVYRYGKFLKRHRVAAGITGVAAAGLTIAVIAALYQAQEARRSRDIAEERKVAVERALVHVQEERGRAEQQSKEAIRQAQLASRRETEATEQRKLADERFHDQQDVLSNFLEGFYAEIRHLSGATAARKRILEASIARLEKMQQESPTDRGIQRTLALAYEEMGELYGDPTNAGMADAPTGIRLLRKANAILEDLHRSDPQQLTYLIGLSNVSRHLTTALHYGSKDPNEAFEAADRSIEWGKKAFLIAPGNADIENVLVEAYRGRILLGVGRDLSRMRLEDVREMRRLIEPQLARDPDKAEYVKQLADAYSAEAQYYRIRLNYSEALPRAERALALREKASLLLRNDAQVLRALMLSYSLVADLYRGNAASGPPVSRAIECYERMSAIAERLMLADPASRTGQYDFAMSLARVASLYTQIQQYPKAYDSGKKSISVFRGLAPEVDKNLVWGMSMSATLIAFGDTARNTDHLDEAENAFRESLNLCLSIARKDQRPEGSLRTASLAAGRLATISARKKRHEEAIGFSDQAIDLAHKAMAVPGAGPFTILRVAQSQGEAALLLASIASEQNDAAVRAKASEYAKRSAKSMTQLKEDQLGNWAKEDRDRVLALANAAL